MASPSRFSVVEGSFVACRRDIVYTVHKTIAQANGQCPHREAMRGEKISPPARNTYRHGDLRRALIEAGTALARDGGPDAVDPDKAGNSGLDPFQLLGVALDGLVETGVLPRSRRPGAEYLAWSAVHGLAMLVIDGPLRRLTTAEIGEISERLIDMVEKGL